jgi:hypothetical protein
LRDNAALLARSTSNQGYKQLLIDTILKLQPFKSSAAASAL